MKKKAASAAAAAGGGRLKDGLRPHRNTVFKKKPPMKGHRAGDNISVAPEPSSSSLLIAEDDEPDFPRGGASMLSREEEAEARAEAEEEFERETKWGGKDRKGRNHKKKKSSGVAGHHTDAEDEWASLFGEGISGKLPRFANRITLKNISPGMKLWGVIAEVNSKDLVISLPGGLRGFVRVEEASDIFPDDESKDYVDNFLCSIFHVGQLVSCIVVQVDDDKREAKVNKRIWLSLRLTLLHKGLMLDVVQDGMALTAQVKSIEDHGYILHFGSSTFSGFLPKGSQDGSEIKMKIGQLFYAVVKFIDKARAAVYLNLDPDLTSKCVIKDLKGLSFDLLVPGMMVNARVHATLENGVMLSFLTYLTGTVDIFHLQSLLPNANWKDEYNKNKKVNARILFIDPVTRAVGLTLNPHLIHNRAPPSHVKTGDIYDNSKIVRVDRRIGFLLEIPSTPVSLPAYVSMFDIADEVQKVEKRFKEGTHVRVRILGLRHLEGLAVGTLKASAFEGSVFTHSDVKPGMLVKGKVIAVESFGAIVQFSSGVKALCPLPHMSEFEIVKPAKKFKIGAELLFRVLGCKSKRMTVTHKKTLVKSKLNVLSSYADATEGLVTHGWITKIETHGCFVRFYNGVQGFAHRSELGLEPGIEANSVYHVGQVIKCRILSSVPAVRRINVSFALSHERVAHDDSVKSGSLVSGVVERLTLGAVIVHVKTDAYWKGTIYNEHLADLQAHASSMKSLLKPGYEFDQLIVLDVDGNNLILSAKYSLITSSQELPLDIVQVHPHSVVHGYICNLIVTGCFVRFLGHLTGFCPKNKALDEDNSDLSDVFYVGQSVRSHIASVNNETDRITLSLKQSSCFSTNASLIQGYFLMEKKIAELQMSDVVWAKKFSVGSVVEGDIQELKDYGVVLGFKDHGDVVGFVSHDHLGGRNVEVGSSVKALVLDIAMADGLVDLSLKQLFVCKSNEGAESLSSKKKRRRELYTDLELHQTVNAVVEIVKKNYLVLSIPEYNHAIGFASIIDYNTQKLPRTNFVYGQSLVATVEALPSPSTSGRLLLLLKSLSEVLKTSSKRAKRKSSYSVGSLVDVEITEIKPLELLVKFGIGCRGRVHITEVIDDDCSMENPFSNFKIGQLLKARVIAKTQQPGKSAKRHQWELSLRPSRVAGSGDAQENFTADNLIFPVGEAVRGYVIKVDSEWLWLTVSRYVIAQMFILDSSHEPEELQEFQNRYNVGQVVSGYILNFNEKKKLLRLISFPSSGLNSLPPEHDISRIVTPENTLHNVTGAEHICTGDIVGGIVKKIFPGVAGILVQIGLHLHGKVHYTELKDGWLDDPLSGYHEGQFIKCKVLQISRSLDQHIFVDLSLRSSLIGMESVISAEMDHNLDSFCKRFVNIGDLHPNMVVKGYVKGVTSKGCFIMLSRNIDARILLSNLSDGYIVKPEMEFPVGKLVNGRVLSVEASSKRVDVTLKTGTQASKSGLADFHNLHVGDVISGRIRRIESYGLFITINNTNTVGLCHTSELSDTHIENIETKYRVGDNVVAKILKVDEEKQRISLGMKKIYFQDDDSSPSSPNMNKIEIIDGNVGIDDSSLTVQQYDSLASNHEIYGRLVNGCCPNFEQVESRASVPPLEVTLDETGDSDLDDDVTLSQVNASVNNMTAKKNSRHLKKKEKEDRELEISASEERRLQKDVPRTADEFEKLVRSSPNSSLVWIKFMAFMLSLADVEKARSVAERALRTINAREEEEKLNVWVAYFNLENEYGSPPEEAVSKMFQRALQYCEPKKLHLALLAMYERTGQHNLANELLEKMIKKFKNSCKVWLRRVQCFLRQGKDGVQSVVNRALLSLPRNKHIKFISQVAILEFKCGMPDRGRSMLEGVLREYPKRTDLWSIYLDQEIRLGDVEVTRALFERATCLSLPPKKMKFLFKKYLEYEKSHGDEDTAEYVKRKALEYVESSILT